MLKDYLVLRATCDKVLDGNGELMKEHIEILEGLKTSSEKSGRLFTDSVAALATAATDAEFIEFLNDPQPELTDKLAVAKIRIISKEKAEAKEKETEAPDDMEDVIKEIINVFFN